MTDVSKEALEKLENSIKSAKVVLLQAEVIVRSIKSGLELGLDLDDVMRKAEIPITVWSAYREFHKIYKGWEA